MKFYALMFTALFVFTALGFFLGWGQGRTAFANECITIGNFMAHDYGLDKKRRFTCEEAPLESNDEADQTSEDGVRV